MNPRDRAAPPLVSIVIPSYNHAAYVEAAIDSVLSQTYPSIELIVIDDGSKDGSAALIEALAAQRGFTFLRNETNLGVNATLTKAFNLARGDYIGTLASDDLYESDKIARQVAFLQEGGLDGVYSGGSKLFADGRKEPIDQSIVERHFAQGTILEHIYITDTDGPLMQSGLFSSEVIRAIDPLRKEFRSDDHMFIIKALEQFRIGFLPETLFVYRIHDENSYKNYWNTLPLRVEIASRLTPEQLRPKYLANIMHSQAEFLFLDGRRGTAIKFFLASLMLWPSPARAWKITLKAVRGLVKRLGRKQQ